MHQLSHLSKYQARAPRYILQPQDNTLIRVSGPRQEAWEETTEIKNLSLTGLAFIANADLCPIIGEIIKIEFAIPGSRQMACFGLVTRLEPCGKGKLLVGIHFQKLELPHRIILLQGLAQKLKDQSDFFQHSKRSLFYKLNLDIKDFLNAYFANYGLSLKMTVLFLFWMALTFFMFNFQSA